MNVEISESYTKIASFHLLCICRISTQFLLCFVESLCLNKKRYQGYILWHSMFCIMCATVAGEEEMIVTLVLPFQHIDILHTEHNTLFIQTQLPPDMELNVLPALVPRCCAVQTRMPSADNGWNCSCRTVLCLIFIGEKDIQEDWFPLKNGSLMVTAKWGSQ